MYTKKRLVRKEHVAIALTLIAAALLLSSCISTQPRTVNKKQLLDPSNSTLAYGYLGFKTLFGTTGAEFGTYYQVNPAFEPVKLTAIQPLGRSSPMYYLQPVETGSSMKLLYFQLTSGRTVTYFQPGLLGRNKSDFRAEKPGLLYLGSHIIAASLKGWEFAEQEAENGELKLLREMLPAFKKTPWQSVIEARIKELES